MSNLLRSYVGAQQIVPKKNDLSYLGLVEDNRI